MYRSLTPSWNAWSGQSGANISTMCPFGTQATSKENWIRSRITTTINGCIRGSRSSDKCPIQHPTAETSRQLASMTTAGNLPATACFNYRWRLELEFAPYRYLSLEPLMHPITPDCPDQAFHEGVRERYKGNRFDLFHPWLSHRVGSPSTRVAHPANTVRNMRSVSVHSRSGFGGSIITFTNGVPPSAASQPTPLTGHGRTCIVSRTRLNPS